MFARVFHAHNSLRIVSTIVGSFSERHGLYLKNRGSHAADSLRFLQADLAGDMYFDIGWGQLEILECARNATGGLNYSKSRLVKVNCQHDQNAEVWDRKNLGELQPGPTVRMMPRLF